MTTQGWPDFDLSNDPVFQGMIRPFIEKQLAHLEHYDRQRLAVNPALNYIFHEHAERVGNDMRKTCAKLGLPETVQNNMYWAMLTHDIGKRLLPIHVWDMPGKPTKEESDFRRQHTKLGLTILEEELSDIDHPFIHLMKDIMVHHHERMDGQGEHKLPAEQISLPVRLACIVEDFDGRSRRRAGKEWESRDLSPPVVLERMRSEPDKGAAMFDMTLFEAFAAMKMDEYQATLRKAPTPQTLGGNP
jgi:HD-GYP domain-containing protein (c-di-GMP phosphodiesterase class II)